MSTSTPLCSICWQPLPIGHEFDGFCEMCSQMTGNQPIESLPAILEHYRALIDSAEFSDRYKALIDREALPRVKAAALRE